MQNDTLRNFILDEVEKMLDERDRGVIRYYRSKAKSAEQEENEEE